MFSRPISKWVLAHYDCFVYPLYTENGKNKIFPYGYTISANIDSHFPYF